jgi:hypothetical protein
MYIITSLKDGIRDTLKNIKLLVLLYFLNLIFSVIIAIPFKDTLNDAFSRIKISENLINRFDFSVAVDFMNYYGEQIGVIFSYVFLIGILYLILNIFLSGGILSIWRTDQKIFDRNIFFVNCAEYFWRFIKILFFIALAMIIIMVVVGLLFSLVSKFSDSIYSSNTINILYLIVIAVLLLLISIILIVYDYAKIILVKDIAVSSYRSVLYSIKFVFSNILGSYSLFLIMAGMFLSSTVIYFALKYVLPLDNWGYFLIILIIQQIYIIFRIFLRVVLYSSQFIYHENKI